MSRERVELDDIFDQIAVNARVVGLQEALLWWGGQSDEEGVR